MTPPWAVWAAMAVACTVLLLRPNPAWLAAHRLGRASGVRWPRRLALLVAVTTVPSVLTVASGPATVVLLATGVALTMFVAGEVRRSAARARHDRALAETTVVVDLLAAELRAGVLPQQALVHLAEEAPAVTPVARVAALGGDVPAAWREVSEQPGRQLLAAVASAWQVSESSGAPLAVVLDRVSRTARADDDLRQEVRSGVEPARATGRVMALLPLAGLALGSGLGGNPLAVVTGSLVGALSVATGLGLACLGVRWVDHVATRAEHA